uniref:MADF domain-containing protein n=1 Tax=Photinus pyralis TaxID=7054 RepID=A0A1Y1L6N2_PHOPY
MEHYYSCDIMEENLNTQDLEVPTDGKERDELLIELIRTHPCVYNKALKEYKDSLMKENAWREIATILKNTVGEVQNRWLRIRQRYSKERKLREREGRSGMPAAKRKKWLLFDLLCFLEENVVKRRTTGYTSKAVGQQVIEWVEVEDLHDQTSLSNSSEDSGPSTDRSLSSPTACYTSQTFTRKRASGKDPIDDAISQISAAIQTMRDQVTTRRETEDDAAIFGRLVAAELRKLSEPKAKKIKLQIINCLYTSEV